MTELWTSSRTSGHRYVGRLVLKLLTPAFVYKKTVAIRTFGYTLFNLGTSVLGNTLIFLVPNLHLGYAHFLFRYPVSFRHIYYIHTLFIWVPIHSLPKRREHD